MGEDRSIIWTNYHDGIRKGTPYLYVSTAMVVMGEETVPSFEPATMMVLEKLHHPFMYLQLW